MNPFNLGYKEIYVIRSALALLKKDCKFDLVTFSRIPDLDRVSELVDTISTIDFLLDKLKF